MNLVHFKILVNASDVKLNSKNPEFYLVERTGSEKNLVKIVKFKEGDSLQVDSVKEIGILKEEK